MSESNDQSKSSFFSLSGGTLRSIDDASATRLRVHRPGVILDKKYEVISLLGEGGMGAVYRVKHLMLNKEMALKTFRSNRFSEEDYIRFQREARAIARLNHGNIVQVFDFGMTEEQIPFYTMEYVQGRSLAEEIEARGVMPVDKVLHIFEKACQGLAAAHDKGIIHRDLKPANMLITADGGVKIMDFGIASLVKADQNEQKLTQAGSVFGSPLYMSPEQSLGEPVDERSDIYSLGCTLFEALTGVTPYRGATAVETIMLHHSGRPPTLAQRSGGREYPPALERLIVKMLALRPENRPESVARVLAELANVLSLPSVREFRNVPKSVDIAEEISPPRADHSLRLLIIGGGVIAVFLVIISAYWFFTSGHTASASKASSGAVPVVKQGYDKDGAPYVEIDFKPDFVAGTLIGKQFGDEIVARGQMRWKTNSFVFFQPSDEFMADPRNMSYIPPDTLDSFKLTSLPVPKLMPELFQRMLRQKGRLGALEISSNQLDESSLSAIDSFNRLDSLALTDTQIDGKALAKLHQLPYLRSFSYNNGSHYSPIIEAIKNNSNLTRLILMGATVTDDDLRKVAHLKKLAYLNLNYAGITDGGLKNLAESQSLERLSIGGNLLTEKSYESLAILASHKLRAAIVGRNIYSEQQKKDLRALGLVVDTAGEDAIRNQKETATDIGKLMNR